MQWKTYCVCLWLLVGLLKAESEENTSTVKKVTKETFDDFIKQQEVRIMYFYKKDIPRISRFKREYEKSASYLSIYNVEFGWADCTKDFILGYCDKKNIEYDTLAFKNGEILLELTVETMFDVNSMVSNVLQIVLLREVPILQSPKEVNSFIEEQKGKENIFFGFFPAIGTFEHRVFMEIAFSFQFLYKFTLTTELEALNSLGTTEKEIKKKEAVIMVLKCKDAKKDEKCDFVKFKENMDLVAMARFARALDLPKHIPIEQSQDLENLPFADNEMHTAMIFYDDQTKEQAMDAVDITAPKFSGLVGFATAHVNVLDPAAYGFKQKMYSLPMIGLSILTAKGDPIYMEGGDLSYNAEYFINDQLERHRIETEPRTDTGEDSMSEEDMDTSDQMEAEKNDDQVWMGVYSLRNKEIDRSHVKELTDKTFYTETKESKLLIVLFYLQFDGRSMAFLRSYAEASRVLAKENLSPLGMVNCFDWTDVCTKVNVTGYPILRIYKKGKEPVEYKGMLSADAIINTVKLYMWSTPEILTSPSDVRVLADGDMPEGIKMYTHTTVLGLLTDKSDIATFKAVAERVQGIAVSGLATGDLAKQTASKYQCKVPCIVVVRRDDIYQPYKVYQQEISESRIVQFVNNARVPVFPELNVYNFPTVYMRKQPLVILFGINLKPKTDVHELIANIAKREDFPSASFCHLDVSSHESIGYRVLAEYNPGASLPALSVVTHVKGIVHNYPDTTYTEKSVKDWLQQVFSMEIGPDRMLKQNEWKPPHPGFDFLQMIDEDMKEHKMDEESEIEQANEEGLAEGFNEEGEEVGHTYSPPSAEDEIQDDLDALRQSRLFHTVQDTLKSKKPHHGQTAQHDSASHQPAKHEHIEL